MLRTFAAVLLLTGAAVAQTQTPQALLQHAIELHQAGDVDGAITGYQEFLKLRPDAYQIRSNLGAALAKAGRYDEAIAQYREALQREPANAGIQLNLALAHYKAGHIVEAEKIFAGLHQRDPGNRQVTMLEADCQLRMGQDKQVIALLTPLQTQTPDDLALDYMLGTALIRDKQTGPGEIIINRVLKAGDSAEARLLMGTTKSNVADFAGALVDLEEAVKLNPNLPDVYSYYGMALLSTGDQAGAAAAFRKELASNPNDFIANLQLGALLRTDQDYDEAETLHWQSAAREARGYWRAVSAGFDSSFPKQNSRGDA